MKKEEEKWFNKIISMALQLHKQIRLRDKLSNIKNDKDNLISEDNIIIKSDLKIDLSFKNKIKEKK